MSAFKYLLRRFILYWACIVLQCPIPFNQYLLGYFKATQLHSCNLVIGSDVDKTTNIYILKLLNSSFKKGRGLRTDLTTLKDIFRQNNTSSAQRDKPKACFFDPSFPAPISAVPCRTSLYNVNTVSVIVDKLFWMLDQWKIVVASQHTYTYIQDIYVSLCLFFIYSEESSFFCHLAFHHDIRSHSECWFFFCVDNPPLTLRCCKW